MSLGVSWPYSVPQFPQLRIMLLTLLSRGCEAELISVCKALCGAGAGNGPWVVILGVALTIHANHSQIPHEGWRCRLAGDISGARGIAGSEHGFSRTRLLGPLTL